MVRARLWRADSPILLASTSTTRRLLLEAAGLPVDTEPSGIDERSLQGELGYVAPTEIVLSLAKAKAIAVSERRPDRIVIGADQILELDDRVFGKAGDASEARRQLARFVGRTHTLVSAVAIARGGRIEFCCADRAALTMRALCEAEIAGYVALAGAAATRSVGCYEAEGLGLHLFDRIEGEHSTILGLPMLPLLAELRRMGLLGL